MRKRLILLLIVLPFCLSAAFAQKKATEGWKRTDTVIFRYPMDIPPEISGSFAELRGSHFHGGTDFRTLQREGIKVYSAAPGNIIRACVEKKSYGKSLYIRHPDGIVSVYAHLKKFMPAVERRIKRAQKESRSYEVTLDNLNIKTKPGQAVARSGNTGSSGGPHLHLELRRDSVRLNPSVFGLKVFDTVPPELYFLAVYEDIRTDTAATAECKALADSLFEEAFMDAPQWDYAMQNAVADFCNAKEHAHLGTRFGKPIQPYLRLTLPFNGNTAAQASYYTLDNLPDTLAVAPVSAFGLCALDRIQNMPFHYGLYELAFLIDDDTLAYYRFNELSPAVYANINRHIDTVFYKETRKRLEKSWIEPNMKHTSPYCKITADGKFKSEAGIVRRLRIVARDFAGNQSETGCFLYGADNSFL